MESTFYLKTNFDKSNQTTISFIKDSIIHFYEEIDNNIKQTSRLFKDYHLKEYGEMTLVNFFINGIVRNDKDAWKMILNEFPIKKENEYGRIDIIIEDRLYHDIYYVEAKKVSSNENAPKTKEWKLESTNKYYENVFNQLMWYIDNDKDNYDSGCKNTFYKMALIFDYTVFNSDKYIEKWYFEEVQKNEFYAFKTYPYKKETLGLACYGKTKEYKS